MRREIGVGISTVLLASGLSACDGRKPSDDSLPQAAPVSDCHLIYPESDGSLLLPPNSEVHPRPDGSMEVCTMSPDRMVHNFFTGNFDFDEASYVDTQTELDIVARLESEVNPTIVDQALGYFDEKKENVAGIVVTLTISGLGKMGEHDVIVRSSDGNSTNLIFREVTEGNIGYDFLETLDGRQTGGVIDGSFISTATNFLADYPEEFSIVIFALEKVDENGVPSYHPIALDGNHFVLVKRELPSQWRDPAERLSDAILITGNPPLPTPERIPGTLDASILKSRKVAWYQQSDPRARANARYISRGR